MLRYNAIITFMAINLFLHNILSGQNDSLRLTVFSGKENIETVDALNTYAESFLYVNLDSACFFSAKAKDISKKLNYKKGMIKSIQLSGKADMLLGHYNDAYDYFFKALRIAEEIKDSLQIAEIYHNLGTVKYYQNEYDAAEKFMKKAVEIFKSESKTQQLAKSYNNLGLVYSDTQKTDSAEYYFQKTVEISRENNDIKTEISALGNIARLYMYKGDYLKAAEKFETIIKKAEKINDISVLSVSKVNISLVYLNIADTETDKTKRSRLLKKSKIYAEEALEYAKKFKSQSLQTFALGALTEVYKETGDYKKALEYFEMLKTIEDSIVSEQKNEVINAVETKYENEKKQLKIKNLEKQKITDNELIKRQKALIFTVTAGFIIVLILSFFLFYLYKSKKRALKLLDEKNKDIIKQREKISAQRDKISEIAFELKKVNRTKNKLFSVIAHDLKNPFQGIIGFAEIIKNTAEKNKLSEIEKYAGFIFDASNQTYKLLDNLLDFTKSQIGLIKFSPENISVKDITEEGVVMSKSNADAKNVKIVDLTDASIKVFADKTMMSTVMRNLISNAVKFTGEGGSVTIKTYKKQNKVYIEVSDTGVGIKDVDIPKLFRADLNFSTFGTKNEKGTGLGLVVCKDFTVKNNGDITVKSKEGEGSVFTVSLPEEKKDVI